MERILSCLIPWKIFTPMWLGGAFTMAGLYKGWEEKQLISPSNLSCPCLTVILTISIFNHFVCYKISIAGNSHYNCWFCYIFWPDNLILISSFCTYFLFSVQMEQGNVTSLLEDNGSIKGVQYKTKDGKEHKAFAPLTIVCDGCFSNLRRSLCHPKVELPF